MRVRLTQGPSDNQAQIQHLDLSSAEDIADSIALLREENDRLRKMAASLSMETEDIRRSLSPAASLVATPHLKAFIGLS
jgi:2-keto-3-deoxy-L-rhamnonate aldolase RhmA